MPKLKVGDVLTSDSLKETVNKVSQNIAYTERNQFKKEYNHYAIRLSATKNKFDYKFYEVNGNA